MLGPLNNTGKTQVCLHPKHGRIERAPGKHVFLRALPSKAAKKKSPREFMWVDYGTIPDGMIEDKRRDRRPKTKRCLKCSGSFPSSEMTGTLCRSCYVGVSPLDEELSEIRSRIEDRVYRREHGFWEEVHKV
jgi:hypothetical protein